MRVVVLKLWGVARDVVHDQIGHHLGVGGQRRHVRPGPDAVIDLGVIDRIEARIRPIDRMKEREHVHAPERPVQRSAQQLPEIREGAARQPSDRQCAINCAWFFTDAPTPARAPTTPNREHGGT